MTNKEDKTKAAGKAKGEPAGKGEPFKVNLSPDEAVFWIAVVWWMRNYYLRGGEETRVPRGHWIDAMQALVLRELGIEAAEPTMTEDKLYRKAALDQGSLVRRVFGKDRRSWARGAEAPRFEASVNLTDGEWYHVLNATASAAVEPALMEEISSVEEYWQDGTLFVELLGGILYSLREASPRNSDRFEAWVLQDVAEGSDRWALVDDVSYPLWRRLALNRTLPKLCEAR